MCVCARAYVCRNSEYASFVFHDYTRSFFFEVQSHLGQISILLAFNYSLILIILP